MYTITNTWDKTIVHDRTVTIDAAIDFARKFSRREKESAVVRNKDQSIRAFADVSGKVYWTTGCTACRGNGTDPNDNLAICERCNGLRFVCGDACP